MGVRGSLGLARDAVLPRPDVRGPIGDRAIGPLVSRKLGRRVVDLLVDPLIGGIHAGSVDDMSAAATFPPLLAAAQRRGGLMRALRAEVPAPDPDGPPLFWALDGGMASLVGALAAALHERGVDVRTSSPAECLERAAARGWTVAAAGRAFEADAVVLATPAPAAAALLRPHDDEVAGLLEAIDYASVVLVTFRVGTGDVPQTLHGTGFLVPRRSPHKGREPWAVTACTYLDRKWSHLERGDDVLLRASLGRVDDTRPGEWSDDEVAERAWNELGTLMGVDGQPISARVTRYRQRLPAVPRPPPPTDRRCRIGAGPPRRRGPGRGGLPRRRHPCLHRQRPRRGHRTHALVSGLSRRGRIAIPSVAAGILLALSLPPWGWWPLGLVGAGLLYWRLAGLPWRARVWSGWLAGLGCFAIGLFWARAFNWYGAVVLVLVEALFFAAARQRHRHGAGVRSPSSVRAHWPKPFA